MQNCPSVSIATCVVADRTTEIAERKRGRAWARLHPATAAREKRDEREARSGALYATIQLRAREASFTRRRPRVTILRELLAAATLEAASLTILFHLFFLLLLFSHFFFLLSIAARPAEIGR